jgi:hypothetical protein
MTHIERLLAELQSRAHLSTYQLELVKQYMEYTYGVGFDEARLTIGGQTRRPIQQIKDGKVVATYESQTEAARAMGCNQASISRVVSGIRESVKGYKFKNVKQSA